MKIDYQIIILIAEKFKQWLEEIAELYDMDKDDVQELIKQFLQ